MLGQFEYVGLCSLGGTIHSDENRAGEAQPDPTIDFGKFIINIISPADSRVVFLPICCLDSRDVTDAHREALYTEIKRSPITKFVVLHGTFTADLTLKYLEERKSQGLEGKTIVAVCSFYTAAGRAAMCTDALFNLGGAYYACRFGPSGIYLAMHGALWSPDEVVKDTEHMLFTRKV